MALVFYVPTMSKEQYVKELKKHMRDGTAEKWVDSQIQLYLKRLQFQATLNGDLLLNPPFPCLTNFHVVKIKTENGFMFIDEDCIKQMES